MQLSHLYAELMIAFHINVTQLHMCSSNSLELLMIDKYLTGVHWRLTMAIGGKNVTIFTLLPTSTNELQNTEEIPLIKSKGISLYSVFLYFWDMPGLSSISVLSLLYSGLTYAFLCSFYFYSWIAFHYLFNFLCEFWLRLTFGMSHVISILLDLLNITVLLSRTFSCYW